MVAARVVDGEVVATGPPRAGTVGGRRVSNYHRLPETTLHAEGWRNIIDDAPPGHDPETERVRRTGHVYDPDDDVVRVEYEVVDRPTPEPEDPEPDGHHDPMIGAPNV